MYMTSTVCITFSIGVQQHLAYAWSILDTDVDADVIALDCATVFSTHSKLPRFPWQFPFLTLVTHGCSTQQPASPTRLASHTPAHIPTQSTSHTLPWHPLPFMSPSTTHPELLLLQWTLHTLEWFIEAIIQHPIILDPIPSNEHFTDHNSVLFVQFRNSLHRLAPIMLDLNQGRRLLQFLPGSPGSHGHYRMDPTVRFPAQTSNFLTTRPLNSSNPLSPPPQQRNAINHLFPSARARSRSRDRTHSQRSWDAPLFHRHTHDSNSSQSNPSPTRSET